MRAIRQPFAVVALCLAVAAAASVPLGAAPVRVRTGPDRQAPAAPSVLVVNQVSPGQPEAADDRGRQVELFLRHFTPNTVRLAADEYMRGQLFRFDRVVVIGNTASTSLPAVLVNDLVQARRPVLWMGSGLDRLPVDAATRLGFTSGPCRKVDLPRQVDYRGQRYPARPNVYCELHVTNPAVRVLAAYRRDRGPAPYIVRSGNLWYVNGVTDLDSDYPDPDSDAPTLIFADILHDFFGTGIGEMHRAVIRLEDVSVHVDPGRLKAVVDYLSAEHVPFVLGLIPTQVLGGRAVPLTARLDLVRVVRYAQSRGATIALHGYHHTFGSSEDYEFWDIARDAPLANESWHLYARKVEDGIRSLRDLGIEPRLWETPHYTASPLAYQVFASYFSHANENRDPVSWLPYPAGPDAYGQMLIPETLGYIDRAHGLPVEAQLKRARAMKIVRDGYAVGFYHPVSVSLSELQTLVTGLRRLGYTFADLRTLPFQVYSPYRPNPSIRLTTWLTVGVGAEILQLDSWLKSHLGWWDTVRAIPWWATVTVLMVLCLLTRLPNQWRVDLPSERSLVEPLGQGVDRASLRAPQKVGIAVGALVVVAALIGLSWDWGAPPPSLQPSDSTSDAAKLALGRQDWIVLHPGFPQPPSTATAASFTSSGVRGSLPPGNRNGSSSGLLASPGITADWEVTVYFTAVEKYYSGSRRELRGCPILDCRHGSSVLGTYPSDFIQAVKDEGSGRITTGPRAGMFLNWSIDVGYWLDSAPRDARGGRLEPYVSAAADVSIPYGTPFKLLDCGVDVSTRTAIAGWVCNRLRAANWIVRDRFTQGTVNKHVDLYIGEQDEPDFIRSSERAISTLGAKVLLPSNGAATAQPSRPVRRPVPPKVSGGWQLTIYFTTQDRLFSGPPREVRGCLVLDCAHGSALLGVYPSDFIQAVRRAPGRITKGPHAGKYLNWSAETGFWLDTVPRDAQGLPLRPLVSAAADSGVPFGAHFKILDCGVDTATRRRVDKSVCGRLTSPQWEVSDRFNEGHAGKRLNLFVGEQTPGGPFWQAGSVFSTKNATISLDQ